MSLTVLGSRLERRCVTTCPAALNSRSTAAELHGTAVDQNNKRIDSTLSSSRF